MEAWKIFMYLFCTTIIKYESLLLANNGKYMNKKWQLSIKKNQFWHTFYKKDVWHNIFWPLRKKDKSWYDFAYFFIADIFEMVTTDIAKFPILLYGL